MNLSPLINRPVLADYLYQQPCIHVLTFERDATADDVIARVRREYGGETWILGVSTRVLPGWSAPNGRGFIVTEPPKLLVDVTFRRPK